MKNSVLKKLHALCSLAITQKNLGYLILAIAYCFYVPGILSPFVKIIHQGFEPDGNRVASALSTSEVAREVAQPHSEGCEKMSEVNPDRSFERVSYSGIQETKET